MEHSIEIAIIGTNVLVFAATVALTIVTFEDVIKDQNRTIRDAIKALVTVTNRKPARKPRAEQTELALVPDDKVGS